MKDLIDLLPLLACPDCRSPLSVSSGGLACAGGHEFHMHEGIPQLQPCSELRRRVSIGARLHHRLLGGARIYDFHQAYGGGREIAAHVKPTVVDAAGELVLDIGAGTGMAAQLLPSDSVYVWFDNDVLKLSGFLAKNVAGHAVLGTATALPFRDGAVDFTLMVEVGHHLDDTALDRCFAEAARVTRRRFVFVDALAGLRWRSRMLWHLDLGRFPRSSERLLDSFATHFELDTAEYFRVNHDHVLYVGRPRWATHDRTDTAVSSDVQ